jgi:hypothetical protein
LSIFMKIGGCWSTYSERFSTGTLVGFLVGIVSFFLQEDEALSNVSRQIRNGFEKKIGYVLLCGRTSAQTQRLVVIFSPFPVKKMTHRVTERQTRSFCRMSTFRP